MTRNAHRTRSHGMLAAGALALTALGGATVGGEARAADPAFCGVYAGNVVAFMQIMRAQGCQDTGRWNADFGTNLSWCMQHPPEVVQQELNALSASVQTCANPAGGAATTGGTPPMTGGTAPAGGTTAPMNPPMDAGTAPAGGATAPMNPPMDAGTMPAGGTTPPAGGGGAMATVNGDVDLYDNPGGTGNVIGMLDQGQQVALIGCRDDTWCETTKGWVWGEFLQR